MMTSQHSDAARRALGFLSEAETEALAVAGIVIPCPQATLVSPGVILGKGVILWPGTILHGLARALGEMDRRTIAIEANLRSPRFAAELGLEPTSGLAGILAMGRTLTDELSCPGASRAACPAGL